LPFGPVSSANGKKTVYYNSINIILFQNITARNKIKWKKLINDYVITNCNTGYERSRATTGYMDI
jgi:hypothetical protein